MSLSTRFLRRGAALGAGLALLAAPYARAQSGRPSRFYEVLVTAGYGGAQLRWPTFEEFMTSYTAVNRADVRTAPTLGRGTTQSFGVLAANCCYLGYQRAAANPEVVFRSGGRKRFGVRQGLAVLGVEPRFWIGKRVFLGPTVGLGFGTTRVNVSYVYPDGTESWTSGGRFNGQYSATTFAVMGGAKVGINLGTVLVQLKADYLPGSREGAGIGDLPSLGVSNQLPRHYDQYLQSTGTFADSYSLTDDAVLDDLGMVRVALEVGLRLNRAD